jgi:hypothetical protein
LDKKITRKFINDIFVNKVMSWQFQQLFFKVSRNEEKGRREKEKEKLESSFLIKYLEKNYV